MDVSRVVVSLDSLRESRNDSFELNSRSPRSELSNQRPLQNPNDAKNALGKPRAFENGWLDQPTCVLPYGAGRGGLPTTC